MFIQNIRRNLLASFIGLILALLAGEITCRYLLPVSTIRYIFDEDIGTTLSPSQTMKSSNGYDYNVWIKTNSRGFHDVEHKLENEAGAYRIVILGDSFMEGLQVSIDELFSQRLGNYLETAIDGQTFEVINLGLSGRGPAQYYRILETKGLQFLPDLVIMAIYPRNDFSESSPHFNDGYLRPLYLVDRDDQVVALPYTVPKTPPSYSPLYFLKRNSAFAYTVANLITKNIFLNALLIKVGIFSAPKEVVLDKTNKYHQNNNLQQPINKNIEPKGYTPPKREWGLYVEHPHPDWNDALKITLRMIRETRNLATKNNSQFLAFIFPQVRTVTENRYEKKDGVLLDYWRPQNLLTAYCREWDIDCIDLTEDFIQDYHERGIYHFWSRDGHWNNDGHRLASHKIGQHIIDQIYIPTN